MALHLPKIPIAAIGIPALESLGALMRLGRRNPDDVLVLIPRDKFDDNSVWVNPGYENYRTAWDAAAGRGLVETADELNIGGLGVDIDHIFPRSWRAIPAYKKVDWIRLYPSASEVNRSAGSREKTQIDKATGIVSPIINNVVFANSMQLQKMLGIPVGTPTKPEDTFSGRRSTRNR